MNKYDCPECEGTGQFECSCCGSDAACTACDGTGLDDKVMDVEAFMVAKREMGKLHGGASWIHEQNGEEVGRAGGDLSAACRLGPVWTLYYRDFERPAATKKG